MWSSIKAAGFGGCTGLLLGVIAGCSAAPSDSQPIGASQSALTAAECVYFDANGKDLICHANGSTKNPYTLIKVSGSACEHAHADHAGDYITSADPASPLYDPTCKGGGCLPQGAPCDATLPCCDGLTCSSGTCVTAAPPPAGGGCAAPPPCPPGTVCPPPPACDDGAPPAGGAAPPPAP